MTRSTPFAALFSELNRRHVLRVGAVYLVAAWLVIQVSDLVVPRLGLPDALVTGIILVIAFGFPIVLVLAWALELTPDGRIVRTPPTEGSPGEPARRADWRLIGLFAAASVLALVAFGAATHRLPWGRESAIRSIAVLPFVHMTADEDWLGDGIAEELLDALASIRGLDVAARTSSFQFKDQNGDVREIGRRLDVDAVLEGSVRRSGERLRIAAQLISTATGYHLWSGTFDRGPSDVLALQSEIAATIADTIELRFLERGAKMPGGATSVPALELYWSGRHAVGLGPSDTLLRGIAELREATVVDPGLARAHGALALALVDAAERGALDEGAALAEAGAAAERAIALDDALAGAYAAHGYVLARRGQRTRAQEAFQRALALNASHVPALRWYAALLDDLKREGEAQELRDRARRLDPLGTPVSTASSDGA